jgi:peptide/nickel transport system substrate-binding protein
MLATSLLAAGCNSAPTRTGDHGGSTKYATNGTFIYDVGDDPGTFDPYHSQLIFGYAALAYDSLVNLQPTGKFVSGLAQRWTISVNSATFTLRPDVTCSDGAPLTASQVAADLTYLGNAKNQSPLYGTVVPTVPFKATGDDGTRTVKVVMTKPFGFLLNSIGLTPIMCAKGLANPKLLKSASDGTGPFVLSKVIPGQSYTFTARNGYRWGPAGAATSAPGTPAKVVLRTISNQTTAANLLLSGELNFAQISGQDQQRLVAQGLDKLEVQGPGAWLWFNQIGGRPAADKRVRQALVQTLDLDQVIKVSTNGAGGASTGLIALEPKPCAGNTVAGLLPRHDVAAAAALLDEAGWAKGADGLRRKSGKPLTIDLHYFPAPSVLNKPTAELLDQQWKALGVKVKLTSDNARGLNQVMFQTSNYDVYLEGFGASLPTQMVAYLSGPTPPKGTNLAGIHNQDYKRLSTKAATMITPAACTYWDQAEQALYRNLDVAPISNRAHLYFLKNAEAKVNPFSFPIPTSIRVLVG